MIKTLKTKQFKITALVLAVVLTLSCVFWNSTKVHALEIDSANIQTFAGGTNADGKLVGTDDETVDIGVFITGGSDSKYNATNVKWTHDGTSWATDSTVLYEGANSQQKIYACYPYVAGTTGTITVNAADQIDYLWAEPTSLTSAKTSLNMTHAMTKLVLNPSYGTEVAEGDTIAKIEVQNMYASGTWKISDNTWSGLADTPDATLEMKNNEVLVIPMENCSYFPVVITMSTGKVFKTSINLQEVGNKLEAGTQYNIDLKIGQDVVVLEGITAASWGEPVDGGMLETN